MVMTDPIADMFTRIRNAKNSKHTKVDIPVSKQKKNVADILLKEGFITSIGTKTKGKFDFLSILLKYDDAEDSVITGIKRVSKPGLRVYVKCDEIPLVKGGLGISIVSTSSGIMTGRLARKKSLGGELLGIVW